jgi:hypothetical protein
MRPCPVQWRARLGPSRMCLMRQTLTIHPDSRCVAVTHIDVEIARPCADILLLSYIVSGKINNVRIAPPAAAEQCDALWRHTCFEAFVGDSSSGCYYEYNFSPSSQWAAYRFSGYRSCMSVADEVGAPSIEVRQKPHGWTLQAKLNLQGLRALSRQGVRRLALSAVIEETDGEMSYWALAHPPGKPDFHHPDCFAHELSAAV